jgi:hypothetical protein
MSLFAITEIAISGDFCLQHIIMTNAKVVDNENSPATSATHRLAS